MLLVSNRHLLACIVFLHRSARVLLFRQIVLSFSKIEAIRRLFQKNIGRFFKNDFFDPHFAHTSLEVAGKAGNIAACAK